MSTPTGELQLKRSELLGLLDNHRDLRDLKETLIYQMLDVICDSLTLLESRVRALEVSR